MPYPKAHHLDRKVPDTYSVSNRTKIAFKKACNTLGLVPSNIIEGLMLDFVKEVTKKPKK